MKIYFSKETSDFWYFGRSGGRPVRLCIDAIMHIFGDLGHRFVLTISRKNPRKKGFKKVTASVFDTVGLHVSIDKIGRKEHSFDLSVSASQFLYNTSKYFGRTDDNPCFSFWIKADKR